MMTTDPYLPYLRQADDLFAQGETIKAGQIWQAILKQHPTHAEARAGLMSVKERLLALREAELAAAAAPPATSTPAPAPTEEPQPEPPVPPVVDPRSTAPEAPLPLDPAEVITGALAFDPERLPTQEPGPEAPVPPVLDPRSTAPEAPLPIDPAAVATGALTFDPERLLAEGCTLYDMGQTGDALKKWEQVLALDPDHVLARGYINGARQEMGLPLLQARATPAPVRAEAPPGEEDVEKLLREAVQLYDMGLTEEAISKWERVLVLEPQRHEIEGYLRQARLEVEASTSAQTAAAAQAPVSEPEALELKLRQAEHLLTLQRHEEAAFTFQQALALDPRNASALQGLERCRKPGGRLASAPDSRQAQAPALVLDAQGRISMAEVEDAPVSTESQGIAPPAALLKATPAPRAGLSLPERFREAAEKWPWLKNSRILAAAGGGLLALVVAFAVVHSYRRDQDLKEEVRTGKAAALASVAQQAQAPDLTESPEAIRQEAEAALAADPLRAYFRAQTLLSLAPGDSAGAQLLEKARTGLAGGATGASLPEFQKHLQSGDLEAALRVIDALLRAQPDNADLRARAGHLQLILCFNHASQAKWDEAREDLLRGRALFPGDKTWQARLRLLEHVKNLPKTEQVSWIPLLS
jgi:tetratricopeptide (TPR) repeat protein